MRIAALIGLLLWAPTIVSAQQDQTVVDRVLGNVPDLVTSVVDPKLAQGTIVVDVIDPAGCAGSETGGAARPHGAVRRPR